MIFSDLENVWSELRRTYQTDFSNLVFGVLPDEADVFATLASIKDRLSAVKWMIKDGPKNSNE